MDDNLYLNDGQAVGIYEPSTPDDQKKEVNQELYNLAASMPVLEEVITWFDEQIDLSQSIRNIDLKSGVPAESQILAYQRLSELLQAKKAEFGTWLDAWNAAQQEQSNG